MELYAKVLLELRGDETENEEDIVSTPIEDEIHPWKDGCDECTKEECEEESCVFFKEKMESRQQACYESGTSKFIIQDDPDEDENKEIDLDSLESEFIAYLEDHDIGFEGRFDYESSNTIIISGTFQGIDSEESFNELLQAWAEENETQVTAYI